MLLKQSRKSRKKDKGSLKKLRPKFLKMRKKLVQFLEETGHIAILKDLLPEESKEQEEQEEVEQNDDLENLGLKIEPTYDIDQVVEEVTNYVQGIIDDMDVEGAISSTSNRRSINMQIDTNEPGRIIGYHGKVLKSLQLLAQNYLYNRYSRTFYITIKC